MTDSLDNLDHNAGLYALSIEHGSYRAALRQAIRGARRFPGEFWRMRVQGCFARRNR